MRREAITVDVHDVDIAGALGNSLFQDTCTLIDQRINHPGNNFFIADCAWLNAKSFCFGPNQRLNFRIVQAFTGLGIIAIITRPGFLAHAAHFHQLIGNVCCGVIGAVR